MPKALLKIKLEIIEESKNGDSFKYIRYQVLEQRESIKDSEFKDVNVCIEQDAPDNYTWFAVRSNMSPDLYQGSVYIRGADTLEDGRLVVKPLSLIARLKRRMELEETEESYVNKVLLSMSAWAENYRSKSPKDSLAVKFRNYSLNQDGIYEF